jgi:hypothetical protein
MFRVGFEPTTPVFERAKTVHALDRSAIVIGLQRCQYRKLYIVELWEENKLKRTGKMRSWHSQGTIPRLFRGAEENQDKYQSD